MSSRRRSEPAVCVVVGARGQDGRLLCSLLTARGDRVVEVSRTSGVDIRRAEDVARLVASTLPDEVYLLAAHQHSSEASVEDAAQLAKDSLEVNTLPVVHFLAAITTCAPNARLFYASSSHVFGTPDQAVQDESTPLQPTTSYGISKAAGMHYCRAYRTAGLFASVGILYNHESHLRAEPFLSRRIVTAVARAVRGEAGSLVVGRLAAGADWGYAPDYVDAMTQVLALDEPDDFVIATGELHTVEEFVAIAFELAGLDWRAHVREDPSLLRRPDVPRIGAATRLRQRTGWQPSVDFRGMIRELLLAEGVPATR